MVPDKRIELESQIRHTYTGFYLGKKSVINYFLRQPVQLQLILNYASGGQI